MLVKKSGGTRAIDAPARLLKIVQRRLATLFLEIYGEGKPSVHSFLRERSIVTNARQHINDKQFVFNIDLEDFFGTIHFGRVRGLFEKPPFSFPHNVAAILAHLCCYKGRLPQGAPTSPILANFICRALDTSLQNLAKECRATYTRYCDDITFSFTVRSSDKLPAALVVPFPTPTVGIALSTAINRHSFSINHKKVRLCSRSQRLEVTGLTVNEFPNVRRRYIDEIRGALHAWQAHGLENAQRAFPERYKRQLRSGLLPLLERVLRGKLVYLRMVRGYDDKIYTRLAERYNTLLEKGGLGTPLPVISRVRDDDDLLKAVFVVECYITLGEGKWDYRQGTAFLVDRIGLVTCEHVLRRGEFQSMLDIKYCSAANGDRILISNPALGYYEKSVTVQSTDIQTDFATLTLPDDLPGEVRPLHLRLSSPSVGEPVRLIGYPDYSPGKDLRLTETKICGLFPKFGNSHLEIDALIRVGNSGGPILDSDYYVVGLAKEGAKQDGGSNAALTCKRSIDHVLSHVG